MTALESAPPIAGRAVAGERRRELAAFLRSRRARLAPADIGLAPGIRRRTPGLRREEVALEAGVGVTWYTWLEQGRPIRASTQVLDAVARALRLDGAERDHLYRLADLPVRREPAEPAPVPQTLCEVLTALEPLPAVLINGRWDVLGSNAAYRDVFGGWHEHPCAMRNVLWCIFTEPEVRQRYLNFDQEAARSVAQLRSSFATHVGEPAWTTFIRLLTDASPEFADMWSRHDVARPGARIKVFMDPRAGLLRMIATSLAVNELPEHRIVIYTPADDVTRASLALTRRPVPQPLDP